MGDDLEEERQNDLGRKGRRPDNTNVRLSLLERSYFENKDALVSVHKRITDFKSEVKEDMRIGFKDLTDTVKESNNLFKSINVRLDTSENSIQSFRQDLTWMDRWILALTTCYAAAIAWLFMEGKK